MQGRTQALGYSQRSNDRATIARGTECVREDTMPKIKRNGVNIDQPQTFMKAALPFLDSLPASERTAS